MVKRLLSLTLTLALMVSLSGAVYAHRGGHHHHHRHGRDVVVENTNWIGYEEETIATESYVGYETITGNAGTVSVTNDDALADAWVDVDKNSNDTIVNDCACDGDGRGMTARVSNTNRVESHVTTLTGYADVGNDDIIGNAGDVTVENGKAESFATGFITVNTNITRVRR